MDEPKYDNVAAVILAGGRGTRMKSDYPKVLHPIVDRPMIYYSIENLKRVGLEEIHVVVGFKADEVKAVIDREHIVKYALQSQPLGTAHALQTAVVNISGVSAVLVVNGDDSAFYNPETISQFIQSHLRSNSVASMMTLKLGDDNHLGKVIRNEQGEFETVLEQAEYLASGRYSDEVNCGAYIFNLNWVKENISNIKLNKKGEYYINQLFDFAHSQGQKINLCLLESPKEWIGINTPEQLEYANKIMLERGIK